MDLYSLIVAGGSGNRMGTSIPKQFIEVAGKPVLMHTIERFRSFDDSAEIIVVLPADQLDYWETLLEKYSFAIPHIKVRGGDTRFSSVRNGLGSVGETGLVAIHDGVRPLVSKETISRCFEAAGKFGNAVPVISPPDSLRMVTDQGNIPVERMKIKIIQTPQVFDIGLIKNAYLQDYDPNFTDDATVLEKKGVKIYFVEGNRENIKITGKEDLLIAAALLQTIS